MKTDHTLDYQILELLLRLEVPNVTVYAFAIGNFKRPPEEVSKLMDLARTKLVQICEKGQLLDRYGIRVVVIGRKDLLPPDIKESVMKVEEMTANNKKGCLNVAFPYSSQEEIATAICRTAMDTISHQKPTSTIEVDTIDQNLYTSHSPPLDILIRTSGVTRLSDFLLWQTTFLNGGKQGNTAEGGAYNRVEECNNSMPKSLDNKTNPAATIPSSSSSVHFVSTFWPHFGLLDVLPILLGWQAEQILSSLFSFCQ
ncbi:hypothetical protein PCANC_19084 [Puccinia coronata f. sp. avenae]|uniref:Alkyl transferase n=1 Tax=Puccinia coronata f. sp. avenae TaxID=200324 RepID=A0A2N5UB25_9BASI|nr:hypothetical protein PCANC_19084 [Puccinia coronata f. sp. avenae]